MSEVLVGVTLPQFTSDPGLVVERARAAEELGLDSIWLFDHLWPLSGGRDRPVIECWTALSWLAGATRNIRIGTLVTRSSLRHPALLAKMAATVGAIAPGRVIVGIGSGDEASRAENEAFGIPYLAGAERIAQLEATVETVVRFLRSDEVVLDAAGTGAHGLRPSPRPAPPPAVWVAGRSSDAIGVAARWADGWNGWGGTPERFAQDVSEAATLAGERPLEPTWGGVVHLGDDPSPAPGAIAGSPEAVAARLRRYVDAGARHVVVTLTRSGRRGGYETLAEAVAPRLRLTAHTP